MDAGQAPRPCIVLVPQAREPSGDSGSFPAPSWENERLSPCPPACPVLTSSISDIAAQTPTKLGAPPSFGCHPTSLCGCHPLGQPHPQQGPGPPRPLSPCSRRHE